MTASTTPSTQVSELAAGSRTPAAQEEHAEKPPSTSPTTPRSVQRSRAGTATSTTPTKPSTSTTSAIRTVALPAIPALPKHLPKPSQAERPAVATVKEAADAGQSERERTELNAVDAAADSQNENALEEAKPAPRVAPSSWANLFAKRAAAANVPSSNGSSTDKTGVNGNEGSSGTRESQSSPKSNADHVAEAIRAYQVGSLDKVSFIEPRGLINTGNMCYMNSVCVTPYRCRGFRLDKSNFS